MAVSSTALLSRFSSFPSSSVNFSFKKLFFSTSFLFTSSTPFHSHFLFLSHPALPFSSTSSSFVLAAHVRQQVEREDSSFPIISDFEELGKFLEEDEEDEKEEDVEEEEEDSVAEQRLVTEPVSAWLPSFPTPKLTIKEKKDLASYAHSLGKKLKSQQVGKSGVTATVAAAMIEALEANELLKLKVHGSCPGEMSEVVKQLENATGSAAVGQIGRTVILYRPSLAKAKKKDSDRSGKQQKTRLVRSVAISKDEKKMKDPRSFSRF